MPRGATRRPHGDLQFARTPDGCLIAVNASRTGEGYSRCKIVRFGKTVYLRHRLAWIDGTDEPIPEGQTVRHTCERYACEEFNHLYLAEHPWRKWGS